MSVNRAELLASVQRTRHERTVQDVLAYLDACIEDWKEDLVNTTGEHANEYRGAIRHTRTVLSDIRRDITPKTKHDGGYTG
ncbi:MAG: hypothetical protein LAT50_13700 [Ectothiorhodospiraceae bacterium]|nr:hypothetical protein [Ectothiorhodospiraceae bacterium]